MERPRRYHSLGGLSCAALVLLFCFALLWRDSLAFWNDDYQISILPVFADVARSWSEGHLPLLSAYSWVCGNLAGEFQYGTFSVFINALVVLIWSLPLAFAQQAAALSIAHLLVLALGGYALARERALSAPLAVMVGLIAALNGWMICWGATDWFGALGAFAWLPWAWWGAERALDPARGRYRFLWPMPFVYLLVTGGFPYTIVMLALLAGWLSLRTLVRTRSLFSLWPLALGMLLGFGLSAPAWLALFDYLSGSARESQESAAHFQWLVPPAALPGFVIPGWTVNWSDFSTRLRLHSATELACGTIAPLVLLIALGFKAKALVRRCGWELSLLLVVLICSMLPTAGVFRWSFRWLPLVHLVLALCAAEAWQLLFPSQRWWPAALTFLSLLLTYFNFSPHGGVPRYNFDPRLTSPAPLDPARLYLSVYPAAEYAYRSESWPEPLGLVVRPGSTSMWGRVRLINGYSPIRPAGVAREFDVAIHGEMAPWACDFFPAYRGGPSDLLAEIGVDGIIVASELEVTPKPDDEWTLAYSSKEGRVYHRRGAAFSVVRSSGEVKPEVVEDSRQRVVAQVSNPSAQPVQLRFSRPFFRGYRAWLNGEELAVSSYRNFIPQLELPAGANGRLTLEYRPRWLIYGGMAAALCLLFSLGALVAAWRERDRA